MSYFKEMSPESQGIDSMGINRFLDAVDEMGLELHRLMIVRHGMCVAKGCYAPYKEGDPHPVYSFTKSLTSTAIGFAVFEGILSLDDHIVDIFPEEVPDPSEFLLPDGSLPQPSRPSENSAKNLDDIMDNLKAVTIHHLLCMSCGQETESEDRGENWIHSFFRQPFLYRPGTFYQYNTVGTYLLTAILKKKTGQHLTDYLKPRLFKPLGMGDIFCYHLTDSMQVQAGGGGMKLTLEDMAKFTYFMLHDGYWEGKAILPGWYGEMSRKHMETAGDLEGHIKDWACGYGYQCWLNPQEKSFRADGAFGQFGLVYPTLDLIIIMNAATEQTQSIMDAVNSYLIPSVQADAIGEDHETVILQKHLSSRLSRLCIPALKGCHNPTLEAALSGNVFKAEGRCSSLETIIGGAGLMYVADDHEIREMSFDFADGQLIWKVKEEKDYEIHASMKNDFIRGYSEAVQAEYAATARWRSLHALEIEIRRMDAMSGVRIIFRFEHDGLSMEADETLMTDGGLGMVEKSLVPFHAECKLF